MEEENNRTKWLHVRLTGNKTTAIRKAFEKTTERKLSDFVRKMILRKPLVAAVRNKSMDDLMNELIALRKELNMVGHNFNQAIKRLNALKDDRDIEGWIIYDLDRRNLNRQIEKIGSRFDKMAESWLQ